MTRQRGAYGRKACGWQACRISRDTLDERRSLATSRLGRACLHRERPNVRAFKRTYASAESAPDAPALNGYRVPQRLIPAAFFNDFSLGPILLQKSARDSAGATIESDQATF
jgi:hypothetical protein